MNLFTWKIKYKVK